METEKYYFRVGIFFLVVSAMFVYYLATFGGGRGPGDMNRYTIYFDHSVAGLVRGAPVRMNGLDVGLVEETGFISGDNDIIRVVVDVDVRAPVRTNTVASISFQGITGTSYVALENEGETKSATPLQKQGEEFYPVIASKQSELQAVVASAPAVMEKIMRMSIQMEKLLSDANIAEVQGILSQANGALSEIKMLARTIRDDPSVIVRGSKHEGYKVKE